MTDSQPAGKDADHTAQSSPYIARVPDDILHDIFYLAVASSTPGIHGSDLLNLPGSMLGVVLSHVCRYWRDLSLASPQLWTYIYVTASTKPTMLREFLARSASALLSVHYQGPDSYFISTECLLQNAHTLKSHSTRFAQFEGENLRQHDMELIQSIFASAAPQMHTLRLHVQKSYADTSTYPVLLVNAPLSLRDVAIIVFTIPWLRYSHLTSLVLTYQAAPPLQDLLETLQNSPDLHTLVLTLHGNVTSKLDPLPAPSSIALLHLHTLSLKWADDQDALLHLIARLSFPVKTQVELVFHGEFERPIDLTEHSPYFRARAAEIDFAELRLDDEDTSLAVTLCTEDRSFTVVWVWEGEIRHLGINHIGLAAVPLPSLKRLALHDSRNWDFRDAYWAPILDQIPPSAQLSIHLDGVSDYVARELLSVLRSTGGAAPVCPNLAHFGYISRWNFPAEVLKDILSTFRRRAMLGARLLSLQIERQVRFALFTSFVTQLKEVVDIVIIGSHRKGVRALPVYA